DGEALEAEWEQLRRVRGEVARAIEQARASKLIGASLDAALVFHADPGAGPDPAALLRRAGAEALEELFIVSRVEISDGPAPARPLPAEEGVVLRETGVPGLTAVVRRAGGGKCARCWRWREAVGRAADHPLLCERCAPVVRGLGASSA